MKAKFIIKPDGTGVTEVIDREENDCREVYKITENIGTKVDEEVTGPFCDTAHETTYDG
jgi:hypothetical protein